MDLLSVRSVLFKFFSSDTTVPPCFFQICSSICSPSNSSLAFENGSGLAFFLSLYLACNNLSPSNDSWVLCLALKQLILSSIMSSGIKWTEGTLLSALFDLRSLFVGLLLAALVLAYLAFLDHRLPPKKWCRTNAITTNSEKVNSSSTPVAQYTIWKYQVSGSISFAWRNKMQ